MSKKRLIIVAIVTAVIIGAAAAFLFVLKEDPLVTQAKEEVLRAESVFTGFQNTINAIPALEFSGDVKNDFKMESAFFGMIGYLSPGEEGLSASSLLRAGKLTMAADTRAHPKLPFTLEDFGKALEMIALNLPGIASEDIKFLEQRSDLFDETVKQARGSVPTLTTLTVERNKKTEKYFLEFDRIDQRLKAAAASLDKYSSGDFRAKLKKLKSANELFGSLAMYTKLLIEGKAGGYALDAAKLFPEVKPMEDAIKLCFWRMESCKPVGPFPGDQYQVMFQKLEPLYGALIEE